MPQVAYAESKVISVCICTQWIISYWRQDTAVGTRAQQLMSAKRGRCGGASINLHDKVNMLDWGKKGIQLRESDDRRPYLQYRMNVWMPTASYMASALKASNLMYLQSDVYLTYRPVRQHAVTVGRYMCTYAPGANLDSNILDRLPT